MNEASLNKIALELMALGISEPESEPEESPKRKTEHHFRWWVEDPVVYDTMVGTIVCCSFSTSDGKIYLKKLAFSFSYEELDKMLPESARLPHDGTSLAEDRDKFLLIRCLGEAARVADRVRDALSNRIAADARAEKAKSQSKYLAGLFDQDLVECYYGQSIEKMAKMRALIALYNQHVAFDGITYY